MNLNLRHAKSKNIFCHPMAQLKTEFGSSEALEHWLNPFKCPTLASEAHELALPIIVDANSVEYPRQVRIRRCHSNESAQNNVVYISTESTVSCFLKTRLVVSSERENLKTPFRSSVLTVWAEAKYGSTLWKPSTNTSGCDESVSTCDAPVSREVSPDKLSRDITDYNLSTLPPSYSAPSRNCGVCTSPLISTRAVIQPPGYCEYSGEMICGDCFHSREVVVPWKLVQGYESFRGNVSRKSAEMIHSNFYSLCMSYSQLSTLPLIRSVQSIRIRCKTYRPKIEACHQLRESLLQLIVSLPGHFREEMLATEPASSCLDYCLADLVDILGGSSIIGRTLVACLTILDSHECLNCDRMFTKTCLVCTNEVSCTDIEWTYCDGCDTWFHRTCHARCIGGCPVCANRIPLQSQANFSIDDINDLVV